MTVYSIYIDIWYSYDRIQNNMLHERVVSHKNKMIMPIYCDS